MGEREDFSLKVMHAYVDAMDFADFEFDQAIRTFLNGFRCGAVRCGVAEGRCRVARPRARANMPPSPFACQHTP